MQSDQPTDSEELLPDAQLDHIHVGQELVFTNPWDIVESTQPHNQLAPSTLPQAPPVPRFFRRWLILSLLTLPVALLVGVAIWLTYREPITEAPITQTLQREYHE